MYRNSPRTMIGSPRNNRRANLIKNIILLLLLIAVAVLVIYAVHANQYRSDAHDLYLQKAQVECGDAMTLCTTLSRTAGSNSAETLGLIRAKIYAIDTLSSISVALGGAGERLIPESWFTSFYAQLSSYSTQLLTGMNTSSNQNELTNSLNELSWMLEALHRR